MLSSIATFREGIAQARQSCAVYDYLSSNVGAPMSYEDLLRFQLVYAVSAFDKLMHDLIRIGMRDIFSGYRAPTPKYRSETIAIELHEVLIAKLKLELTPGAPISLPPKELIFEQEIAKKLAHLSFQDPDKVRDGLSLIWDEPHKWQKISARMGMEQKDVTTRLRLIVTRRNAIVHEADIDPVNSIKQPISRDDCTDITDFVERCGSAIAGLIV